MMKLTGRFYIDFDGFSVHYLKIVKMMSKYQKLHDFDIFWAKKLIFVQTRDNLIFIKITMDPND